jgi:8-oxo-dGTP pyrophosphatase MutT (NUDIX family)
MTLKVMPEFHSLLVPPKWTDVPGKRSSAVLLILLPQQEGPACAVLTRRTATVATHKRQICLPGGRKKNTEGHPVQTALRETEEELGISSRQLDVIGAGDPLLALDGSSVVPIVAFGKFSREDIRPEPAEVEEVLLVPWTEVSSAKAQEIDFTMFGIHKKTPIFYWNNERIWGLTAKILFALGMH